MCYAVQSSDPTLVSMDSSLWANPTCQGNLLKKGHVRKNWKWRWFRLQQKNLFYFRTREKGERPIGHIDLTNYIVKKTPSDTRPYGFGLYSPLFHPYPLAAIDEKDYNIWFSHLKLATKKNPVSPSQNTSSREIGILKCKTEGSTNNSSPVPVQQQRARNRSSSSGDYRNRTQNSKKNNNQGITISPKKPVVALRRADEDNDRDDLVYIQFKIGEEDSSLEDFVYESDGEFDIKDLTEKKKMLDMQSSPVDSNEIMIKSSHILGRKIGQSSSLDSRVIRKSSGTGTVIPLSSSADSNIETNLYVPYQENTFIRVVKTRDLSEKKTEKGKKGDLQKEPHRRRYIQAINLNEKASVEVGNDDEFENWKKLSKEMGRRLTTANIPEEFIVESPEVSPRGADILKMAEIDSNQRRYSRSFGLIDCIMDEISEEVVINPQTNIPNVDNKTNWRAIRRSILPSSDLLSLKVVGGNHREISPQELTVIVEEEEKEKLRKLKELYLVKGDPLQKYDIVNRSIGKGAVGEVFFAKKKSDDTKVAIKKLKIERRGRDRLPLILREIEIIATSSHKNIVGYIESYSMEGELWVVMEYMSSGSLYELIKLSSRGLRFDESVTAYCIKEVLKAVEFLHQRKRIHRDIKVDNILINSDGTIKLADFGTAVQLTFQRLRRNTLAGTPYYMAPELIKRIPYNEKVDIWSIGITVIETINGKPPFYDLDPREALDAIITKGVKGLVDSKFSDSIKDFVNNQCLAVSPQDRPTATQLLAHSFLKCSSTKEIFAKFLAQSTVLSESSGSGCTIL